MVYGLWAEAVRSPGKDSLIPVVDSVEAIVDRVYRRQSLQPLVEAARKITETPSVQPGHFPWCRPDSCVVNQYDDGDPYTEHIGPSITMPIPKGMDVRDNQLLHAVLVANEGYLSELEASFNSGGNGVLLAADELDAVIDDLTDFLDGLRSLRGQMVIGASTQSASQPTPAAPSAHASLTQAPENKAAPKSTNADSDAA
ncbi:DUF6907 domain-containing protein [Streptomyces sp. NPDC102364]|uniref:DUF6907 domain-containing protein n=1 Tax=unclassified Streptomyces TaxID=2593676 RepID=UPI003825538F